METGIIAGSLGLPENRVRGLLRAQITRVADVIYAKGYLKTVSRVSGSLDADG